MATEEHTSSTAQGDARVRRVLIMDDDYELVEQWRRGLSDAGFAVTTSGSASEALVLLESTTFDIAVVDMLVKAPDYAAAQGGLRLLREIRFSKNARLRKLSILGVSGYRPMGRAAMAEELMSEFGIDGFLRKPFETADLVERVSDLMGAKR